MKSLQFKKLNIGNSDVLTRLQMKKVTGGYNTGGDGCCAHNADLSWAYCDANLNLSEARDWATQRAITTGERAFYCCDSC